MKTFIDTNYFLRFLLKDNNKQHQKAKKLFQEGALSKTTLFTSKIVFLEIFWVLKSFYKKDNKRLLLIMQGLFNMAFIEYEEKELLQRSLDLYSKNNIKLEDCYNLAFAKDRKAKKFKTFDKKLLKLFK